MPGLRAVLIGFHQIGVHYHVLPIRGFWRAIAADMDSAPSEHMDQAFVSQCDIGERIIVRER
jgi:hypothetical protein